MAAAGPCTAHCPAAKQVACKGPTYHCSTACKAAVKKHSLLCLSDAPAALFHEYKAVHKVELMTMLVEADWITRRNTAVITIACA